MNEAKWWLLQYPNSELAQPLCFPADIYSRWCKLNVGLHLPGQMCTVSYVKYFADF